MTDWSAFDPPKPGAAATSSPAGNDPWAAFNPGSTSNMHAAIKADNDKRSVVDKLTGVGGERYQTWPERLVRGAISSTISGATAPRDVLQGKLDPNSTEGIRRGMETAATILGAGSVRGSSKFAAPATPSPGYSIPPPPPSPAALQAQEFGVQLSKGKATGDLDAIRFEDLASRGAYGKPAQDVAAAAVAREQEQIAAGGRQVGNELARGQAVTETPNAAGATINDELSAAAARARTTTETAQAAAAREAESHRNAVEAQGHALTDAIENGNTPIADVREAGLVVGENVRAQANAARQNYQRQYAEASNQPGEFDPTQLKKTGTGLRDQLAAADEPVIHDNKLTPSYAAAVRDLDNIDNFRPTRAIKDQPSPPITLQGTERMRKRLVAYYQDARSAGQGRETADTRAMSRLISAYEDHVEGIMQSGGFTGRPDALEAMRAARGSYREYAQTYRPQRHGDDVGAAMRKIVDRAATPEEIGDMLAGSTTTLKSGLPVRIVDRLESVLGRDSEAFNAIRQAPWVRASQVRNRLGDIDPVRSSEAIRALANSSLGRRLYSDAERIAMNNHARGLRTMDQMIDALPATQGARTAQAAYQRAFGGEGIAGQQEAVFKRIMDGSATAEETMRTVFDAMSSQNPGSVKRMLDAIEGIAGPQSDSMAAIRQGAWQRLTQNAAGKDQPGAQQIAQNIGDFLTGRGKTIAEQLYTADERAKMARYAAAAKSTVIPKLAATRSDTTPGMMAAARKHGEKAAAAIGAGLEVLLGGGVLAGAGGAVVGKVIGSGVTKMIDKQFAKQAERSYQPLRITVSKSPPPQISVTPNPAPSGQQQPSP